MSNKAAGGSKGSKKVGDKQQDLSADRESGAEQILTTNQGVRINDNQNSLKAGDRGPTLLEDFILREKITHFDHERIPERVVHARGSAAHGYFQVYESMARIHQGGLPAGSVQSRRRCSFAFRPSPDRAAQPIWRATCAALP